MAKYANFVKARNDALFSLRRERIEKYMAYRGLSAPNEDTIFWGSVYKEILCIPNAPVDVVVKALKWLEEHGMQTSNGEPCIYQIG